MASSSFHHLPIHRIAGPSQKVRIEDIEYSSAQQVRRRQVRLEVIVAGLSDERPNEAFRKTDVASHESSYAGADGMPQVDDARFTLRWEEAGSFASFPSGVRVVRVCES